jgi:hypothetical protein
MILYCFRTILILILSPLHKVTYPEAGYLLYEGGNLCPTAESPDEKCSRSDLSTSDSNLKMRGKYLDVAFARKFDLLCSDECVTMFFIMTLHNFISRLQAILQSK